MMIQDKHALPDEPGAAVDAGTAGKQKKVSREAFNASIGHGQAGGGSQTKGTASGDPTITYARNTTWAPAMGRGGKFGTPFHTGKQPINYDYGDGPEEY